MKIKLKYFFFLFICISCSNSDKNIPEIQKEFELPPRTEINENWKNLIIGKWKYIQQCEFDIQGGGCNASPSTNYYTFKSDSVVLFDSFINDCQEGIYSINDRIIYFSFACIDHEFEAEIRTLSENYLIFTFTGDDSVIYRVYERDEN
jgi:hypothetical protein